MRFIARIWKRGIGGKLAIGCVGLVGLYIACNILGAGLAAMVSPTPTSPTFSNRQAVTTIVTVVTPEPTNRPANTATPSPTTPPAPKEEWVSDIPENLLLKVDDSLLLNVDGTQISLTLTSYEQTELETGYSKTRHFKTKFLVRNLGDGSATFAPAKILSAGNDGGRRLDRGGQVYLDTTDEMIIGPKSEIEVILDWHTAAYDTTSGRTSDERVFIAVNTPMSNNLSVVMKDNSGVFVLYFPESQ